MIVVPGRDRRLDSAGRSAARTQAFVTSDHGGSRQLFVVGLGPGPDSWITPEAAAVLGEVDHVVGYGPYLDRLPARPTQQRHATGNTVELERARHALDLALAGERVAVVSGGDAGIFGMAAAVFEAAADDRYAGVNITVLPGVTAAQAVAARAGAPLGGDYAVVSLSDRLKPWSVIEQRLRADRGSRPGAGYLQPGLAYPTRADRPSPRAAARAPPARNSGGGGPQRRPRRRGSDRHHAGRA